MAVAPARLRAFQHVFPRQDRVLPTPQASPYLGAPSSPSAAPSLQDPAAALFNDTQNAFRVIIEWLTIGESPKSDSLRISEALNLVDEASVVSWLKREIQEHVQAHVEPSLVAAWTKPMEVAKVARNIHDTADLLKHHFEAVMKPLEIDLEASVSMRLQRLRRAAHGSFQAVLHETIPGLAKLRSAVSWTLFNLLKDVTPELCSSGRSGTAFVDLFWLCHAGGLAVMCHKELATAVQSQIRSYVSGSDMRVDWIAKGSRVEALFVWIETKLCPAIGRCLQAFEGIDKSQAGTLLMSDMKYVVDASLVRVGAYQKMALNILGNLRLPNLLDYVQRWPDSAGAIFELKQYSEESRQNKDAVRAALMSQMSTRLLHAGATTAELLGFYVNLIHVCFTLSPQGVLLERVAGPLRGLLRDRSDTVKVIAASFLAELDENDNLIATTIAPEEVCPAITREVLRSESLMLAPKPPLDWSDMNWQPDPIEAGPDHRVARHNDVVHFTMSLFERDAFVKEIEGILGERLLRSEDETLAVETRLVDMLKSRLGDDRLQAADVMLRDMRDSVRVGAHIASVRSKLPRPEEVWQNIPEEGIPFSDLVNKMKIQLPGNPILRLRFAETFKEVATVRPFDNKSLLMRKPDYQPPGLSDQNIGEHPPLEAKVVSSFFWPKLRDDQFKVPDAVKRTMQEFEREFVAVKKQRKLEWMSALGRATVELELTDRTVRMENVKTWVAAVIDAFQKAGVDTGMEVDGQEQSVKKSVSQLEEELNMDELLVRNAVSFWVGNKVLREVETDTYEVLETLPAEGEVEQVTTAPRQEETVSALKSKTAVLEENKQLYEMFITGMLTNGGAMEPMRIAMMLGMAMPNGFEYGNEGVLWILQGMEADGKVEKQGEAWAIKK